MYRELFKEWTSLGIFFIGITNIQLDVVSILEDLLVHESAEQEALSYCKR